LKPHDEKEIEVVCNADEVQPFTDTLHIIVNNGVDLEVALKAKGIGNTLWCKKNPTLVDFLTEYTHNPITKEYFLENRGRKQMKIQWVNTTKVDRKKDKNAIKSDGKKGGQNPDASQVTEGNKEEEVKFVYCVEPESIVLNAKMGIMVKFKANSFNVGKIIENWQCQVTVGSDKGSGKPKTAWNTTIMGEFITPGLVFSEPKLYFKYLWEKGVASMPITK
jgi:hydrocephalus-inducing protein